MLGQVLVTGIAAILAAADSGRQVAPVGVDAREFEIGYGVNPDAEPLESVELWFTGDEGASWQRYGLDEDHRSPVRFRAPAEGVYGFYLVLTNGTGASSPPPRASTEPQLRAFVDFTPPIVQLQPPTQTRDLGQRIIQFRWAAIDANLQERPVEVEYRVASSGAGWKSASDAPLGNTGRYDWRVPAEVTGALEVRIHARDKGGHVATSDTRIIELVPDKAPASRRSGGVAGDSEGQPAGGGADRARSLLAEAVSLRKAGRLREGIAVVRKAIRLDPESTEAFAEMAGMLYRMNDLDRALDAYELALRHTPTHRPSLQGSAMILRRRNHYSEAADRLRTALRTHPEDAELWMNLGDVAIFRGDEIAAREAYQKALESERITDAIKRDAQQRLELMADVSRKYR